MEGVRVERDEGGEGRHLLKGVGGVTGTAVKLPIMLARPSPSLQVAVRVWRRPHRVWPPTRPHAPPLLLLLLPLTRSLYECGGGLIADGRLLDLLRRVSAFDLSLLKLDIRQVGEGGREGGKEETRGGGQGQGW